MQIMAVSIKLETILNLLKIKYLWNEMQLELENTS